MLEIQIAESSTVLTFVAPSSFTGKRCKRCMWAMKKQFEYSRNTKTGSEHVARVDKHGKKKGCSHGATLAGILISGHFSQKASGFTWDIQPFEEGKELPLPQAFLAAGGAPSKKWGVPLADDAVEPPAKRRKVKAQWERAPTVRVLSVRFSEDWLKKQVSFNCC